MLSLLDHLFDTAEHEPSCYQTLAICINPSIHIRSLLQLDCGTIKVIEQYTLKIAIQHVVAQQHGRNVVVQREIRLSRYAVAHDPTLAWCFT